jgi:hypothetical protein
MLIFIPMLIVQACTYPVVEKVAPEVNFVKKGSKFRICLPEDHQLGETWQLQKSWQKDAFEVLGSVWHGNKKGVEINIKALITGQYTLTVVKRAYIDTIQTKCYLITIVDK